ncbi:MAG: hypothetical protein V9F00_17630 [Nocardioides sp.]
MEEWTRSLSGRPHRRRRPGAGSRRNAALDPQRDRSRGHRACVARLRARWVTEDALRAFADELDDSTGDLVAANLILGARRRGAGLASVLEGLAESVAADVRARRQVEADRAKPRATARWVTLISARRPGDPCRVGDVRRAVQEPTRAGHPRHPARRRTSPRLIWMKRMAIGTNAAALPRTRRGWRA